ncbi:MAG TPA: acyltransferase family protein [Xanthomonadaceae bacterium]|nr:acyltransferase family protein [Xanthomonadaceae bacterium]
MATATAPLPGTRRHDLDWIRVLAFLLLILYHVGMYYVTWDWHVKSPFAGPALEPLMLASAPWRLSLLFLVSGVATAFLLDRSGPFLGPRSWRLLVPLVFGMLVVVPPQSYCELLDSHYPGGYHDGYLAFWGRYLAADHGFCDQDGCLRVPTWNHLWFVAYLWAYTVVLWGARRLLPATLARAGARVGGWLARGANIVVAPALFLAIARIALVGRFEQTHALLDDWYDHAQYLPVFLLGYWIARDGRVWERLRALRWPALACSTAGYAFIVWYFGAFDEAHPPGDLLRMAQRVTWGAFQWSAIAAILGFGRQVDPGESRLLRYLTDAVFPFYILHQTVIVVLAWELRPLALRPPVEGPLLVLATIGACLLGYELVRRVRWLRPLFGLRPQARRIAAASVGEAAAG